MLLSITGRIYRRIAVSRQLREQSRWWARGTYNSKTDRTQIWIYIIIRRLDRYSSNKASDEPGKSIERMLVCVRSTVELLLVSQRRSSSCSI
jgi:hypothetical protein